MDLKEALRSLGKRLAVPRKLKVEAEILFCAGAAAAFLFLFVAVADLFVAGRTHALDEAVMLALRSPGAGADPLGPAWLEETMRDMTSLGSNGVLLLAVAMIAGFLILTGRRRHAALIVVLTISGMARANVTKLSFERPRPDLVPHATQVFTLSFPSQHALMSAVVYLTLAALLARTLETRQARAYVMAVAILLTVLVGVSRVYLGVHWPTDVLAGWALGAAWASICWLLARFWTREKS